MSSGLDFKFFLNSGVISSNVTLGFVKINCKISCEVLPNTSENTLAS